MLSVVQSYILIIGLVVTLLICADTMKRCQSEKRHYFVLGLFALAVYILGYIAELLSPNLEAALAGSMLMYTGSIYITPLYLLFIMDFCEYVPPHKYIRRSVLLLPMLFLFFIWTSRYHSLFLYNFSAGDTTAHLGLQAELGVMYYVTRAFSLACALYSGAIIAMSFLKWERSRRFGLLLLISAVVLPMIVEDIILFLGLVVDLPKGRIHLSPYILVIANLLVYYYIILYDIFDFAPRAYKLSFDLLSDTVILVDADLKYNGSNYTAVHVFPDIENLNKGSQVTKLAHWPIELTGLGTAVGLKEIRFTLPGSPARHFTARVGKIESNDIILGFCIVIRDITELELAMERLRLAAYTDPLTELYNRRHFYELAAAEICRADRSGNSCGVMMIDIDFFKKCNDTYGHSAGDEVLRIFASSVKDSIRQYDLLARYGGEEFVVLIPDTGETECMQFAERIRTRIEQSVCVYKEHTLRITCSIGVTIRVRNEDIDSALTRADKALYHAKETGRNKCVYL